MGNLQRVEGLKTCLAGLISALADVNCFVAEFRDHPDNRDGDWAKTAEERMACIKEMLNISYLLIKRGVR